MSGSPAGTSCASGPTPRSGRGWKEIVRAERECCSFLEIDLEERGAELELAIEAPAGGEETAAALAAAFDRAPGGGDC